jgi:hypothetical protein
VLVGFGFMGKTHSGNILKNPDVQLTGIAENKQPEKCNRESVPESIEIYCRHANVF